MPIYTKKYLSVRQIRKTQRHPIIIFNATISKPPNLTPQTKIFITIISKGINPTEKPTSFGGKRKITSIIPIHGTLIINIPLQRILLTLPLLPPPL